MGLVRKTLGAATVGTVVVGAYLGGTTTATSPLPADDALWTSAPYRTLNVHANAATQDIVTRRIPLSRIRPELLTRRDELVTEFCRGVWSGWGYEIQRRYLARKYRGPATSAQLWERPELAASPYDRGTRITDHFEVVEKTSTAITVRCGDSPRTQGPRDSDGLFVLSADIDPSAGEVVLGLKSCFFNSARRIEGIHGPMPSWMEPLHRWYSRLLMADASRRLQR